MSLGELQQKASPTAVVWGRYTEMSKFFLSLELIVLDAQTGACVDG